MKHIVAISVAIILATLVVFAILLISRDTGNEITFKQGMDAAERVRTFNQDQEKKCRDQKPGTSTSRRVVAAQQSKSQTTTTTTKTTEVMVRKNPSLEPVDQSQATQTCATNTAPRSIAADPREREVTELPRIGGTQSPDPREREIRELPRAGTQDQDPNQPRRTKNGGKSILRKVGEDSIIVVAGAGIGAAVKKCDRVKGAKIGAGVGGGIVAIKEVATWLKNRGKNH